MSRSRIVRWFLVFCAAIAVLAAASPWIVSAYWRTRSSNPVRRGVRKAADLGCFSCHGEAGRGGIPIPGSDKDVPAWSGGVWMMYVRDDEDIRRFILDGSSGREGGGSGDDRGHEDEAPAVVMPAYRDVLSGSDLEDLVAAFKVLAGMSVPPADSPARRGYELAREWRCFSCHGPAGSGGLPNPGSFTGFIPGWYGADFEDLVRNREEFDAWIVEGNIRRLAGHPVAGFFVRRQQISMPAYRELNAGELDDLWAYAKWLDETGGGHRGGTTPW